MLNPERIEPFSQPEQPEQEVEALSEKKEGASFAVWTQKGIAEALEKVKERFEDSEGKADKDKNLDFHTHCISE